MRRFWSSLLVLIILAIIAYVIWYFATGQNNQNNNGYSNTAASQTATKNQIRTNWGKFFSGSTTAQEKINLLQNGQQFAQVIDAYDNTPTAKAASATVSSVTLSGNTAKVNYTINVGGKPELANQTGQAIYTGGTWKISDTAFCGLLKLAGTLPPLCPGGSTQPSQQQSQQPSQQSQTKSY